MQKIKKRLFFYLQYGSIWLITLLPMPLLYWISDLVYLVGYYVVGYRKQVVWNNLRNAFPEKTDDEIKKISKRFLRHLSDNMIESAAMVHMNTNDIEKRYKYKNEEYIHQLAHKGKSVYAVMGHYGNWDWLAALQPRLEHNVYAIYKPLKDKRYDKIVRGLREKFGVITIPKKYAVKKMLEANHTGELIIVLFLGDQAPPNDGSQYWTTFLNQDTGFFTGIEKIARKTATPVVYFDIQKPRRGYYEANIVPISEEPEKTRPNEITEKHIRQLEQAIKEKPEFWLWSHRRWKKKRPANQTQS